MQPTSHTASTPTLTARRTLTRAACLTLLLAPLAWPYPRMASAQTPVAEAPRQTEADEYTRYELLAPETASFRILYDVTATTPGARHYFNPIRKGSEASDERVVDLMTGEPLTFEIVKGTAARATGHPSADPDTSYIKVHLARPVPPGGGARLRIDKTYKDPKSYYREGDAVVYARSLGIKRNAVVLPAGFELVSCNYPSQILTERDGRLVVSFMNAGPDAVSYVVKAKPARAAASNGRPGTGSSSGNRAATSGAGPASQPAAAAPAPAPAPSVASFAERAFQDRDIVYFLEPPETHAFRLYHDYTESREGVDRYLNVVRRGSTVSNPSAKVLDTGAPLETRILRGDAIRRAALDIGEEVRADSEVVLVRFPPVKKGQSIRLRIEETYSDPGRYGLAGGTLTWRRSFGRPRNAIVLPDGWSVTSSSIPAVVTTGPDGRVRLDYWNPRPDEIDVALTASRRD